VNIYRVLWEVEIEATTGEIAADRARQQMLGPVKLRVTKRDIKGNLLGHIYVEKE
jgi:hypothetical protein